MDDHFDETKRLEFSSYFVCVDYIPSHFVEGCFVHFNEKINCTLLDGIDERNIYIFFQGKEQSERTYIVITKLTVYYATTII